MSAELVARIETLERIVGEPSAGGAGKQTAALQLRVAALQKAVDAKKGDVLDAFFDRCTSRAPIAALPTRPLALRFASVH